MLASDTDTGALAGLPQHERFRVFKMDVSGEEEVRRAAQTVAGITDSLDVLVSNAGIFDFYPLSEAGGEKLSRIFEVNTFALASLTKYFTPLLTGGRLIVISSESYKVPSPFQPYAVSKQALESLYSAIRMELATLGIRCVLIRPGAIRTRILEETIHFENKADDSLHKTSFGRFLQSVPKYIGRTVSPDRVADTVLKAGTAKRPRAVYSINHHPLVSMLSLLPSGWQERLVLRNLGK